MNNYILVKDAITKQFMLIKKDMICTVEEYLKDGKGVRAVTFTDSRREKYIENTLMDVLKQLDGSEE